MAQILPQIWKNDVFRLGKVELKPVCPLVYTFTNNKKRSRPRSICLWEILVTDYFNLLILYTSNYTACIQAIHKIITFIQNRVLILDTYSIKIIKEKNFFTLKNENSLLKCKWCYFFFLKPFSIFCCRMERWLKEGIY